MTEQNRVGMYQRWQVARTVSALIPKYMEWIMEAPSGRTPTFLHMERQANLADGSSATVIYRSSETSESVDGVVLREGTVSTVRVEKEVTGKWPWQRRCTISTDSFLSEEAGSRRRPLHSNDSEALTGARRLLMQLPSTSPSSA